MNIYPLLYADFYLTTFLTTTTEKISGISGVVSSENHVILWINALKWAEKIKKITEMPLGAGCRKFESCHSDQAECPYRIWVSCNGHSAFCFPQSSQVTEKSGLWMGWLSTSFMWVWSWGWEKRGVAYAVQITGASAPISSTPSWGISFCNGRLTWQLRSGHPALLLSKKQALKKNIYRKPSSVLHWTGLPADHQAVCIFSIFSLISSLRTAVLPSAKTYSMSSSAVTW